MDAFLSALDYVHVARCMATHMGGDEYIVEQDLLFEPRASHGDSTVVMPGCVVSADAPPALMSIVRAPGGGDHAFLVAVRGEVVAYRASDGASQCVHSGAARLLALEPPWLATAEGLFLMHGPRMHAVLSLPMHPDTALVRGPGGGVYMGAMPPGETARLLPCDCLAPQCAVCGEPTPYELCHRCAGEGRSGN